MKNNVINPKGVEHSVWKFDLKMKLSTLFIFISLLTMQANETYSQKTKLSIDMNEVTVNDVIREIESLSDFKFFYNRKDVNLNRVLSINAKRKRINNILSDIFSNTTTEFEVLNKQIILKKRTKELKSMILQSAISGTVVDSDNIPLGGVNVLEKGTTNGTTTDFDGNYSIEIANSEAVIVVSYIGFATKEIVVGDQSQINITMEPDAAKLQEVVVLGSRNKSRTAIDTAVPIDILNVKELTQSAPQVSINQILNYAAPSFTSNSQSIADGTDHIDPASLRGLGPDQVLVLINGKRRHKTSLVNVNGTFGRGSAGTDLNAIPSHAIDRIEILRDGAAAQYGSDAIAGVINIVLKKSTDLNVLINTGANFTKNEDKRNGLSETLNDGERLALSLNYGIPLGDDGGFINFTGAFDFRGRTNRMLQYSGSIYNAYNSVERVARADGYDVNLLADEDLADIFQYAPTAGITLAGNETLDELRGVLGADVSESELTARGLERDDFNMNVGQSELRNGQFFVNMALPVGEDLELYAFGGLGFRGGESAGFFRLPNQSRTFTPAFPDGFLPEIHTNIIDKSLSAGIRGKLGDWDMDFSNTYGRNSFAFIVRNSSNASLGTGTPFEADSGGFSYMENTTNFDMSKYYEDVMSGFNLAFGAEYRLENYGIIAGNEVSYSQYDTNGNVHDNANPNTSVLSTFFGDARPGGIQVFPGFSPDNELDEFRSSVGLYVDAEADISKSFLLAGAVRYENFSDFGGTLNAKLTTRIKFGENFNLRGGVQTGFRAPSLHQIHFNSTSTITGNDGVPVQVGNFKNSSRIARILGIEQLDSEKSTGVTVGFTGNIPGANLKITVDGYRINIKDRVISTGQFGTNDDPELIRRFAEAGANRVAFFANAIDTETTGLDVVINHKGKLGSKSSISNTFAFTFSKTEIGDVNIPEAIVNGGLADTFLDPESRTYIESSVPRVKGNLSHNLKLGEKWNLFLRNAYFGEVTEATNVPNPPTYAGKILTDLSIGYKFSKNTTFTFGANNLLDVYQDQTDEAFSSSGRFLYSRRSYQFGSGGRHLFARLNFIID